MLLLWLLRILFWLLPPLMTVLRLFQLPLLLKKDLLLLLELLLLLHELNLLLLNSSQLGPWSVLLRVFPLIPLLISSPPLIIIHLLSGVSRLWAAQFRL